ncbi:hypothetical protein FDECE_12987 [Fusarium decemcellulare]|nr:hypothetical protein FDECE_12987 [Fusarium decemcellulare]
MGKPLILMTQQSNKQATQIKATTVAKLHDSNSMNSLDLSPVDASGAVNKVAPVTSTKLGSSHAPPPPTNITSDIDRVPNEVLLEIIYWAYSTVCICGPARHPQLNVGMKKNLLDLRRVNKRFSYLASHLLFKKINVTNLRLSRLQWSSNVVTPHCNYVNALQVGFRAWPCVTNYLTYLAPSLATTYRKCITSHFDKSLPIGNVTKSLASFLLQFPNLKALSLRNEKPSAMSTQDERLLTQVMAHALSRFEPGRLEDLDISLSDVDGFSHFAGDAVSKLISKLSSLSLRVESETHRDSSAEEFGELILSARRVKSLAIQGGGYTIAGNVFSPSLQLTELTLVNVDLSGFALHSLIKQSVETLHLAVCRRVTLYDGTWEKVLMALARSPCFEVLIECVGYSQSGASAVYAFETDYRAYRRLEEEVEESREYRGLDWRTSMCAWDSVRIRETPVRLN